MRNKIEILEYLGIEEGYVEQKIIDKLAEGGLKIEEKYQKELDSGKYGYCLKCDFDGRAGWIEDNPDKLKFIEGINGIVVYKK